MTNKKLKYVLLSSILLISLSIITINLMQTSSSGSNYRENDEPQTSTLSESHIIYTDTVYRVLDEFSVELDLTDRDPTANTVNLTIAYSNGTISNYTMAKLGLIFSKSVYIPANASIGTQNFNLTVFAAGDVKINETDSDLQFEILNSYPQGGIMLSETEIYRNNTLYYNVTPSDAEDSLEDLTWESKIMRVSTPDVIATGASTSNNLNETFKFLTTYANAELGQHYVQLNVTDKDGNSTITKAYFTVKNNNPNIEEYSIEISNPDGTNLDSDEIIRINGEMIIDVNISDIDVVGANIETAITNNLLKLKVIAHGSDGTVINLATLGTLQKNFGESDFRVTASIPSYVTATDYNLVITVYENTLGDGMEYNSSETYNFELINNNPNATKINLEINDLVPNESGLKFNEYDDLVFNITIVDCDAEGIVLIRLVLINEDNEYLNFTFANPTGDSIDMIGYTMRARDLASGTWKVHVYVIDGDGVEVVSERPVSFDIKADTFSKVFPWLMLVFGITMGAVVSLIVIGPKYIETKRDLENITLGLNKKPAKNKNSSKKKQKVKPSKKVEEIKESESESNKKSDSTPKTKKRKMTRKIE